MTSSWAALRRQLSIIDEMSQVELAWSELAGTRAAPLTREGLWLLDLRLAVALLWRDQPPGFGEDAGIICGGTLDVCTWS